jgi:hypothetical protein
MLAPRRSQRRVGAPGLQGQVVFDFWRRFAQLSRSRATGMRPPSPTPCQKPKILASQRHIFSVNAPGPRRMVGGRQLTAQTATTPLGLFEPGARSPNVARASQRWAGGHNPLGIEAVPGRFIHTAGREGASSGARGGRAPQAAGTGQRMTVDSPGAFGAIRFFRCPGHRVCLHWHPYPSSGGYGKGWERWEAWE